MSFRKALLSRTSAAWRPQAWWNGSTASVAAALPLLRLSQLSHLSADDILNYSESRNLTAMSNQICLNNQCSAPHLDNHATLLRSHALSRSVQLNGLIYPCRHLQTHLNRFLIQCCLVQQRSWVALCGLHGELTSLIPMKSPWRLSSWTAPDAWKILTGVISLLKLSSAWAPWPEDVCVGMLVLGHLTHVLFSCMFDWTWLTFDFSGAVYYRSILLQKWSILV